MNEFEPWHIEFLSNIVRLYRQEEPVFENGSRDESDEVFPDGEYRDVDGRCYVATIDEIEEQDWSLNPGRYVGVKDNGEDGDFDFETRLSELQEEFELLTSEAHELEDQISENLQEM